MDNDLISMIIPTYNELENIPLLIYLINKEKIKQFLN